MVEEVKKGIKMFIDILDNSEKNALMSLLVSISKADGEVSAEEEQFLVSYASENGVELDMTCNKSIEDLCSQIQSNQGKVVTVQELIKLAIIDGHYDPAERKGAAFISSQLGLSEDKFISIEEWVIDGQKWVERGYQLLS